MKITTEENVEINVHKINLYAKVADCCAITLYEKNGNSVLDYDGYVPTIIPNAFGNINLEIDVNTGIILNWNLTKEKLAQFIAENKDEYEY